jgi:hypothetical protein
MSLRNELQVPLSSTTLLTFEKKMERFQSLFIAS